MDSHRNTKGQFTKGHRYSLRHGVHRYLQVGRMPAGCSHLTSAIRGLEAELTDVVKATHGGLMVAHKALIQSACRHEARAALVQYWLCERAKKMTDSDRLAYLREIGAASDARDRCLKALGLDRAARDTLDSLFLPPPDEPADEPAAGDSDPPASQPESP